MKKQFLLLIVVFLTSLTMAWGQAIHHSIPRPLICTDDALHPIAGKAYTYEVATTPSGGDYRWWATRNSTFIVNSAISAADSLKEIAGQLAAASSNYGGLSKSDTVSITWSSEILAATTYTTAPTFVAVHYIPATGACADNFKVFEIDPKNGFTVDIKNIEDATKALLDYDAPEDQCVAPVSSATYNAGAHTMNYLYGIDTLFFEVVAANFSTSWTPTFQLTGLAGDQVAVIQWDYSTAFTAPVTVTSGVASTTPVATSLTNTSNGVSIFVRVIVTNNHYETLAAQTITLAVDGTNSVGDLDVVNTTCVEPATADFVDVANQIVNPRPTVVEGTTSTIPSTPPNTGIIPKNP